METLIEENKLLAKKIFHGTPYYFKQILKSKKTVSNTAVEVDKVYSSSTLEKKKAEKSDLNKILGINEVQLEKRETKKKSNTQEWELYRVVCGHTGWVKCIDFDPQNEWFATGSADRLIKIWDLASGRLKLSLAGHVHTVTRVKVSDRHPYLFSAGEDKAVKCWDLEQNKVVRHYHGHLSGVTSLTLHPSLDLLVSGGRDCVGRVWDMRTKQQVQCLEGHSDSILSLISQNNEPQITSSSDDKTVRLWDLRKGESTKVLTHHSRGVRALCQPENKYEFVSASTDNIKVWQYPEGIFDRNISGHSSIINALAVNSLNQLVSGADDGSLYFWDYSTGECTQKIQTTPQTGSLSCESAIFDIQFDKSSQRMITAEMDKTIKMWRPK